MGKKIIIYGVLLALLTVSMQVIEYKLLFINHSLALYGGVIAVIFTILGIAFAKQTIGKKEVVVEKLVFVPQPATAGSHIPHPQPTLPQKDFQINNQLIDKLGISKREYEILEFMAQGCSNQEIADKAFVSVSTVKTHVSNLFVKLDVQRRTQAVNKAKEMQLIA